MKNTSNHIVLFVFLLASLLSVPSRAALQPVPPEKGKQFTSSPHQHSTGAGLAGLPKKARESISQHLKEATYHVRKCEKLLPSGETSLYWAFNSRQDMNAYFSEDGVHLVPGGHAEPGWHLEMSLFRYGYEGALQPVEPLRGVSVEASDRCIEFQRGGIIEWYLNDDQGLEQGITLDEAPANRGTGPLVVEWEVTGPLVPRLKEDNTSITFEECGSQPVLHYNGLKAWDAEGHFLSARFAVRKGKRQNSGSIVSFIIDDATAQYPVYIDPVFTQVAKLTPNEALGLFGYSLSIDLDTLVVGAYGDNDNGDNAGAVYIFYRNPFNGDTWDFVKKITAAGGEEGDHFGCSVSINGDTLVVGAPNDDDNGTNSGSAYIFSRHKDGDDNWGKETKFAASDGSPGDLFGHSVSVSDDTVIIGAHGSYNGGSKTGAAYIFTRNGSWTQGPKLFADDGASGDRFGWSVSISGDTAVIGADRDYVNAQDTGSAYVFQRNDVNPEIWNQTRKITASDGAASDRFGWSVSISGDTVVVGALNDDDLGSNSGSAYVFRHEEGAPDIIIDNPQATFVGTWPSSSVGSQKYGNDFQYHEPGTGYNTAIWRPVIDQPGLYNVYAWWVDGEDKAVHAPYTIHYQGGWEIVYANQQVEGGHWNLFSTYPFALGTSGYVELSDYADAKVVADAVRFQYADTGQVDVWTEVTKLTPSDGSSYDQFGYCVAVSGDAIVVGANIDDDNGYHAGSAYIFYCDPGDPSNWIEATKITPEDGEANDQLGSAVALSDNTAVVGVPFDDDFGTDSGSAYIFTRNQVFPEQWDKSQKIIPRDDMENDEFGYSIAISEDTIVVGARGDDENGEDSGAIYIFYRDPFSMDDWDQVVKTTPDDVSAGDAFGYSVAVSGDFAVAGSPFSDLPAAEDCGAAYIFYRNQGGNNRWGLVGTLVSDYPEQSDLFGYSVSISGDTVVIGAPNATNIGGTATGVVNVYHRDSDYWLPLKKLEASDGALDDQFGHSVSVDTSCFVPDDRAVIVGAPNAKNSTGDNTGAAYLFYYSPDEPGQWYETKILPTALVSGDNFGYSVSIDKKTVVIGSPYDDQDLIHDCGAVHVFSVDNAAVPMEVNLVEKIAAEDFSDDSFFGCSIAVEEEILLVGACGDSDNTGGAYIFEYQTNTWTQNVKLSANDGEAGDRFGHAVSIDRKAIAVGAPHDDDNGINSGSAYVFRADDSDGDGIPDIEEQGPYGMQYDYDGNMDGTADKYQAQVASFPTHDGADYVTMVTTEGYFRGVESLENPSPGDVPAGVVFPSEFFSFIVAGMETGGATTLTISSYYGALVDTYWEYGPTFDNTEPHWFDFFFDGVTGVQVIGFSTISLDFIDGDRGDSDLVANGEIVDLGAPALNPPPDLVITDVWDENDSICYQLRNIGYTVCPAGHRTMLYLHDVPVAADPIEVSLSPGERLSRCFSDTWYCTPPDDDVNVCADDDQDVDEYSEANNCRRETWQCDVVAPVITAVPVVSEVGQDSVDIAWTTDTVADSVVMFGTKAGVFDLTAEDLQLTQNHQVHLEDLSPSTTYHYVVLSTDESGNKTESRKGFFRTAPLPDIIPPDITLLNVEKGEGDILYYNISATVGDNVAVERVQFYMDGEIIGVVYSPPYEYQLVPAFLDMDPDVFFSAHTLDAVVYDHSGMTASAIAEFDPEYQCEDIHLEIQEPPLPDVLFIEGPTVPGGTTVPITVYASIREEHIRYVPGRLGPHDELPPFTFYWEDHPVSEVNFFVNMNSIDSLPPADDHVYSTNWNLSGYPPGEYTIRVDAIANDECKQTLTGTFYIEIGEPELQVSRQVTRVGNYFEIALNMFNGGNLAATFDEIVDNVKGFQPIAEYGTNYYSVYPRPSRDGRYCDIEFRFYDSAYTLEPNSSATITYHAVPVMVPYDGTAAYFLIGAENVRIISHSSPDVQEFYCPGWTTEDGRPLVEQGLAAFENSDYLIITNPDALFATTNNTARVNALLSSMAELAKYRNGVLGYLSGPDSNDPGWVKDCVRAWGSSMRGSDGIKEHYLSNGYLLLVGETEIIPSFSRRLRLVSPGVTWKDRRIHCTDLPYGDTNDHIDPELSVGRIIGNRPSELRIPLRSSVNVVKGEPGFVFDRSHALVVSGRGEGVTAFEKSADDIGNILDDEFDVTKRKKRSVENAGGNINAEFKLHDANKDVFVYIDHCSPESWSGVIGTSDFFGMNPVEFDDAKPFAFALCCSAGTYEGDSAAAIRNIAETFLWRGAAVYIGSTETSYRDPNNDAGKYFFNHWVNTPKPVGQVFKELKVHQGGYEGDYWSYEYNLYGDPRFGGTQPLAMASPLAAEPLAVPPSPYDLSVPDYEIETALGADYVEIPGGNMLLVGDKPAVPYYVVNLPYPEGYTVGNVTLIERSGLRTETGLNIPLTSLGIDATVQTNADGHDSEEWWPTSDMVFEWDFQTYFDGTSLLTITVFPFYYNSLTTDVAFYKNYSFNIQSTSTGVDIVLFTTNGHNYEQGESATIDLWLSNSDTPQDVIVEVVVKDQSSDEVVDGLFLHTLKELTGEGCTLSLPWDTGDLEPGDYYMEANIRDSSGNLLRTRRQSFSIGIHSIEIESLTAIPDANLLLTDFAFRNTGTVETSGNAVLKVLDENDQIVEAFSHEFSDLPPSESWSFTDTWDISGIAHGSYRVQAYVLYHSKSSPIKNITIPICPDLANFASAFGSVAGDSRYEVLYDLDCDGDVDGLDLAVLKTYLEQMNCP